MKIINRQIKLHFGEKVNIRYFIKEEERIIIAIAKFGYSDEDGVNPKNIIQNSIMKKCESFGFFPIWNQTMNKRLEMADYYRSIAKCDTRDEWSEEEGLKVVTEKIECKLNTAVINRYAAVLEAFKNVKFNS